MSKKNFLVKKKNVKKKPNYILRLACIYSFFLIIGTALFIALFWIKFFDFLDILFFKSLVLLSITICVIFFSLIFLKKLNFFKIITTRDIIIICLLSFILNESIYKLVPFNTSRSVSVMIVGYLYNNKDRNISNKELNQHIYKLYFLKENAVKMRIAEQIGIGNVKQIENQYKLTDKGLIIVNIMSLITEIFNTKKNYIKNLD
jgi:hypothetical protein